MPRQERPNDAKVVLPFLFCSDAGAALLTLGDVLVVVEMQYAVQLTALMEVLERKMERDREAEAEAEAEGEGESEAESKLLIYHQWHLTKKQ